MVKLFNNLVLITCLLFTTLSYGWTPCGHNGNTIVCTTTNSPRNLSCSMPLTEIYENSQLEFQLAALTFSDPNHSNNKTFHGQQEIIGMIDKSFKIEFLDPKVPVGAVFINDKTAYNPGQKKTEIECGLE